MHSEISLLFHLTEFSPVRYGLGNLPDAIPLCNPALLVPSAAHTSLRFIILTSITNTPFLFPPGWPWSRHTRPNAKKPAPQSMLLTDDAGSSNPEGMKLTASAIFDCGATFRLSLARIKAGTHAPGFPLLDYIYSSYHGLATHFWKILRVICSLYFNSSNHTRGCTRGCSRRQDAKKG